MKVAAARFAFLLLVVFPASHGAILLAQDTAAVRSFPDTTGPPPPPLTVGEVLISGNEKTRDFVILREMSLRPGEEITREKLAYDRERIYSLRLFNRVQVTAAPAGSGKANIMVEVNERWYIFPFPILGLRDRDWSKVFYGVGVAHNNFRGRNEKLFGSLVLGYDPAVSLSYRNSFLDEGGSWFMDARSSYSRVHNRSLLLDSLYGDYQERHITVQSTVGRRMGRHHSVSATVGFRLVELPGPGVLSGGAGDGRDAFPVAGIGYVYDTRDLQEYPSMGTMVGLSVTKYGVPGHDPDFFRVYADVRHFLPLPAGLTLAGRLFTDNGGGKYIPVYSRVYFGYAERIRGHFSEVLEGDNLAGAAVELHLPLLEPRYIRLGFLPEGFNLWRFGIGAALFGDAGATWFRESKFSIGNLAKGYGGGIHLLLPYSAVLRLEYALDEAGRGEFIVDIGAAL